MDHTVKLSESRSITMTSQRVSTLIFALAIASLSAVTRGAEGSLADWYTKGTLDIDHMIVQPESV